MAGHSLAAAKRLRKELQVLSKQPKDDKEDIVLTVDPDNLLKWTAWIRGPDETPFESGVFQLEIRCGTEYPLAPPTIKFVTKVRTVVHFLTAVHVCTRH
jgi:peroxin-4